MLTWIEFMTSWNIFFAHTASISSPHLSHMSEYEITPAKVDKNLRYFPGGIYITELQVQVTCRRREEEVWLSQQLKK